MMSRVFLVKIGPKLCFLNFFSHTLNIILQENEMLKHFKAKERQAVSGKMSSFLLTAISSMMSYSLLPASMYFTANLVPSLIFWVPLNHCMSALGLART